MVKFGQILLLVTVSSLLSACVTQNYNNDTPVIEQNSSKNELAMTRISLGLGYLKMGNTTQAKFNLEKAKNFSPNLVEVYTAFAHYYETVDEPELTVEAYEKALSIKADDANTLNNYGVFLCRQERYDEAEEQFLKAIAIPSYLLVSESYENLASCQLSAGNFDQAEIYLSKAITHSPNRGSAIFQMVRLEYAMGDYKSARYYTQKFEKVTRRFNPESLALAVKVYQHLGDGKISSKYGSMLVSMYPTSWEAKQYILNGLERIEADDLADVYNVSSAKAKKDTKRVVVLTPHNRATAFDLPSNPDQEAQTAIAKVPHEVEQVAAHEASMAKKKAVAQVNEQTSSNKATFAKQEGNNQLVNSELTTETEVEQLAENIEIEALSSEDEQTERLFHTVTKGDNLYGISLKYNIRIEALERWNNINQNSKIQIGDKIYLTESLVAESSDE